MNVPQSLGTAFESAKGLVQKAALPATMLVAGLAANVSGNVANAQVGTGGGEIEAENFAGVRGIACEGDCALLLGDDPKQADIFATPGLATDLKIQCPPGWQLGKITPSMPNSFAEPGKPKPMYGTPRAGETGMILLPVTFPNVNMPVDDSGEQKKALLTFPCISENGKGTDQVDFSVGVVSTKDVPAYGRGADMGSTGGVVTGGSRSGKFKNLLAAADLIVSLEHADGDDADSSWHNGVGGRFSLMYKLSNLIEGGVVGASMVILNQPDAVDTETNGKANITRLITAGCLDVGYLGDGFEAITGGCVAAASGPKFTNKETDVREKADPIPVDGDVIGAVEAKFGATFGISDSLKGGIGAFGIFSIEHDGGTAAGIYFGGRSK